MINLPEIHYTFGEPDNSIATVAVDLKITPLLAGTIISVAIAFSLLIWKGIK